MFRKLALYFHTARHIRGTQLLWFVYRRLRPSISTPSVAAEISRGSLSLKSFARSPQPEECEFRFLNVSASADPVGLDWHPDDKSRLWRYNLHYFDYLAWDSIPNDYKRAYLDQWVDQNPMGTIDAWEPYTLSLRIVNWLKFFQSSGVPPDPDWQNSLLNQANWLLQNLEFHILANHFLKNAKALVFAGACFEGPVGEKCLRMGLRYFLRELDEQILPDGGHFERSPMYHSIVVEDCLDVLNLAQAESSLFGADTVKKLHEVSERALGFLAETLGADGRIALFNDSAYQLAPDPVELIAYGKRLGVSMEASESDSVRIIAKPDSGYFGYVHGEQSILVDCGPVSVGYQPGHAHCDMLSYELCLGGRKLIVDPGVHGYDGDDTRAWLRSTSAHNTLSINGEEQSEIWGTFRVARRARPVAPEIHRQGAEIVFEGAHDGYCRLPQKVLHHRRITAAKDSWRIEDRLTGTGTIELCSYVHFNADIALEQKSAQQWALCRNGDEVALITVDDGVDASVDEAYIAPEFGKRIPAFVLKMKCVEKLPFRVGYLVSGL